MSTPPVERALVLVVDDDARNRALMRAYLSTEYELREADSGAAALAVCRAEQVDIVLLDVMMPGMSGYEVCRALKATASQEGIPVLLLTALSEQDDRNQGLEAGADDFLSKPINRQELLLRVRHFLTLRRQRQLLTRQYEALLELTALKDDLVTLMVHDLRNPLTSVLGLLQIMEGEALDPVRKADATVALQAGEKLREMVDDMLQVRLLEEGRLNLQRRDAGVDRLIDAAMASVQGAARVRKLALERVRAVHPLVVAGDIHLLRRAIENLLSNAIKFSPTGQKIEVTANPGVAGQVEIQVADRGRGVSVEARETLFHKYGGLGVSRGSDRRGYGLGLYFVRLVAEAHGGRVAVADRDGGGTVMSLILPGADPSGDVNPRQGPS